MIAKLLSSVLICGLAVLYDGASWPSTDLVIVDLFSK
jgi:hypothetical protein